MYVKITNGSVEQYPYTLGNLRRDNPNVSFPKTVPESTLNDYGVFKVEEAEKPAFDVLTQSISEANPAMVDGKWTQQWTISDRSEDQAATNVRAHRASLLSDTDYLALSDNTLSAEMAAYRQALRDITAHENFPYLEESDWPVKP